MMVDLNEDPVNQLPSKERPEAKEREIHCKWGRWTYIVDAPTTTTLPVQTDDDVNPNVDEMDPALWGELYRYVNLEERIFANLPLHAFYRALSVCKKWYNLREDCSFLEQWSKTSLPKPYFILHGDRGCHQAMLVRDDARSRTTSTTQWELQPLPYFAFQQPLTSVVDGLVFTGTTENLIQGTIFNIHTKVFRKLPPLQSKARAYSAILAFTDKNTGSYKVMVSWDYGPIPSTISTNHVYDSLTGTWAQISNNPAPARSVRPGGVDYAYCDGVMYIKREKNYDFVPPQALFAYNFEHDVWTVLARAPQGVEDVRVKGLGKWNGVLCDVTLDSEGVLRVWEFQWTGLRRRRSHDELQEVQNNMPNILQAGNEVRGVWVVQQTGQQWVEVNRMPTSILKWFLEPYKLQGFVNSTRANQRIKTSYCEQYILLSHHGFAENSGLARLVLYDMALRSWEILHVGKDWICPCPFSQQIFAYHLP